MDKESTEENRKNYMDEQDTQDNNFTDVPHKRILGFIPLILHIPVKTPLIFL